MTFVAIVAGILGLLIGSFLNVVVHRVPAGMSVIRPASACPRCGNAIRRRDNVPVLSWVTLRARCRDCSARISARYPAVEAATCVLFVLVTLVVVPFPGTTAVLVPTRAALPEGFDLSHRLVVLAAFLYLMAISVALALIDLDTHTLPNRIILPAYAVLGGLFLAASILSGDWGALARAVVGAFGLGAVYLGLAVAVPGGMGLGDVKLAVALGFVLAYLGWGPLAVGSFSAFFLGGMFAIVLLLVHRSGRRTGIPFGPWMLGGAWVGIVVGGAVWDAYLRVLSVV